MLIIVIFLIYTYLGGPGIVTPRYLIGNGIVLKPKRTVIVLYGCGLRRSNVRTL